MYIKHHFSTEEARQFCGEFGIDWHWSRSIEDKNSAALGMRKAKRSFTRVKVKDAGNSRAEGSILREKRPETE